MELGHRILELRLEKDIGQKELASYLNVSVGTISNYEHNVHCPDINTLTKLADYFDVSLDYLACRTDYRKDASALNRPLTTGYSLSDFINSVSTLPPKDVNILVEQLELLLIRNSANKSTKNKHPD